MTRVPSASRELVAASLRAAFDEAVRSYGSVPQTGNWSTLLYSPEACLRIHHWADCLRDESSLSDRIRELAMLVVAREFDCSFIWNAHASKARSAGLAEELLEALRDRKSIVGASPDESAVIKFGLEFYRAHRVGEETFHEAMGHFGARGLVELIMLMGFYATLAFNVNAFDIAGPLQA